MSEQPSKRGYPRGVSKHATGSESDISRSPEIRGRVRRKLGGKEDEGDELTL